MSALSAMMADAAARKARLASLSTAPSLEDRVRALLSAVAVLQGRVTELERGAIPPCPKRPAHSPRVMEVVRAVAELHEVPADEIISPRRDRRTSWARFDVWHRLHTENPKKYSLSWLGRKFCRDHTSVMHGIAQWESQGKAYLETL